jgi:hypothetical protein
VSGPYGPTIVNGIVRYTSASALTTADPNSYSGCLRSWWYRYVDGRKPPQTAAMKRGTEHLHKPIENYYQTGARVFPPWVMVGQRYFPERGDDLAIEHEICLPFGVAKPPDGDPYDLSIAPLRLAGIPVVGKIDLTHARGVYIDNSGELIAEPFPESTMEFVDWKSTSAREYAKTAAELRRAIQMLVYPAWGFTIAPALTHARLSHTYFLTKGSPESWKVTTLMEREEHAPRWEYVESVARSIADAAKETDADKIPANKASCNTYRTGCPHKSYCSAAQHNSLSSRFGGHGSSEPGKASLVTISFKQKPAVTTPSTPTVTPVNTAQHVGVQLTMGAVTLPPPAPGSMTAQILAEEAAALKPTTVPAQTTCPADIASAFQTITRVALQHELGAPKYTGRAAVLHALAGGQKVSDGYEVGGHGRLSALDPISDPASVLALAADLESFAKTKAAEAASVTVTVAPAAPPPTASAVVPTVHITQPVAILPAETPASDPRLAALPVEGLAAAALGVAPAAAVEPEAPKKKGGRPKGSKNTPKSDAPAEAGADDGYRVLYLNAIPSCAYEPLQPNIDELMADMSKQAGSDVRCSDVKPYAFGGWKGLAADSIREAAPNLPGGHYALQTLGSEINACIAEALISARTADGSPVFDLVVRGQS